MIEPVKQEILSKFTKEDINDVFKTMGDFFTKDIPIHRQLMLSHLVLPKHEAGLFEKIMNLGLSFVQNGDSLRHPRRLNDNEKPANYEVPVVLGLIGAMFVASEITNLVKVFKMKKDGSIKYGDFIL